jgi:hypothetical protein
MADISYARKRLEQLQNQLEFDIDLMSHSVWRHRIDKRDFENLVEKKKLTILDIADVLNALEI